MPVSPYVRINVCAFVFLMRRMRRKKREEEEVK